MVDDDRALVGKRRLRRRARVVGPRVDGSARKAAELRLNVEILNLIYRHINQTHQEEQKTYKVRRLLFCTNYLPIYSDS